MAKRYECPHCGERTISAWRRAFLGPALPTRCSSCRQRVGVSWSMTWLGAVVGLAFFGAMQALAVVWPTVSWGVHLAVVVATMAVLSIPLTSLAFRLFPLQKR